MGIPREIVEKIEIIGSKTVYHRSAPPGRRPGSREPKEGKCQVEFGTIDDRDMVTSYAVHLKGKATINVVVLDNLKLTRTKLEHYAYKYCQQSKEISGGDKTLEAKTKSDWVTRVRTSYSESVTPRKENGSSPHGIIVHISQEWTLEELTQAPVVPTTKKKKKKNFNMR